MFSLTEIGDRHILAACSEKTYGTQADVRESEL